MMMKGTLNNAEAAESSLKRKSILYYHYSMLIKIGI